MFYDKFGRGKINAIIYKNGKLDFSEKEVAHWEILNVDKKVMNRRDGVEWLRVYIYLTPHAEAGWYRVKTIFRDPPQWYLRNIIEIEKKLRELYEKQCHKNNIAAISWCKPF